MDLTPNDDRPEDRRGRTTLGGETPDPAAASNPINGPAPMGAMEPETPAITDAELAAKLEAIGHALNRLHHPDGAPDLWLFQPAELEAISGPGARELNKRGETLRRVLTHLDLVAVLVGFVSYLGRQLDQLRELRADLEDDLDPADHLEEPEHRGPDGFGLGDLEGMPR